MNKLKRIPTPLLELAVTNVLSITVAHMDDCHHALNELGSVSIYCKTNDEIISAEITSYNLETGKPETVVHLYGAESSIDDVIHLNFNLLIDILKTVQDEPLKTVAQLLLDDLTVKFADVIKEGK